MSDQNGNAEDNVSLDPLTPEEALRALLSIPPQPPRDDDEPENAATRADGDE